MSKHAFVTGAAGFLGRHLTEVLAGQGWQVHALIRQEAPAWMKRMPALIWSRGDLTDTEALNRSMPRECDAVFHLAGNTSSWIGDRAALHRDNVMATQQVLEAAIRRGARRLVMTSTLGIFERHQGVIREQTPLLNAATTRNPYLRSKLQADRLLETGPVQGLSVVRIHPGHMLGRYDQTGWIQVFNQVQENSLGPAPKGSASFCLASDVALAHVRAATLAEPSPRYVIATADASYLDLFNAIAKRLNKPTGSRTVPSGLLKAVACAAQWRAAFTGKAPTITPGLAEILSTDLVGRSELAMQELGIVRTPLDAMLQETHEHWKTAHAKLVRP